jgi:hypothetical protein
MVSGGCIPEDPTPLWRWWTANGYPFVDIHCVPFCDNPLLLLQTRYLNASFRMVIFFDSHCSNGRFGYIVVDTFRHLTKKPFEFGEPACHVLIRLLFKKIDHLGIKLLFPQFTRQCDAIAVSATTKI